MRLDAATQIASLISQDKQDRTASFQGGDTWAAKLTLGQIIKGKVLRSYGDGRYGVDFSGEQRVVDSGIPLSVGDQLRGRVVGLSERVTIERLTDRSDTSSVEDALPRTTTPLPQDTDSVNYAAQQLHIRLSANNADMIAGIARKVSSPELAIRAGLFLAKLGLPLSVELVRTFYERISTSSLTFRMSAGKFAPILDVKQDSNTKMGLDPTDKLIGPLTECLANDCNPDKSQIPASDNVLDQAENQPSAIIPGFASDANPGNTDTGGSFDTNREHQLATLLAGVLNVQTGARLQHRFRTLPVVIGGRLVEFDLALFDHVPRDKDGVHTKRLRFSLSTEHGPVDVDATAIDNHVQIAFASNRTCLLDALEEHSGELGEGLQQHGWMLDGTAYRHTESGTPACSIVDHILMQDSLRIAL